MTSPKLPQSGGSYTRSKSGALRQKEATKAPRPAPALPAGEDDAGTITEKEA